MHAGTLKRGMGFLVAIAATAVVCIGLIWVFQRRLVYFPSVDEPLPPAGVEEVSYATDDGLELSGWLVPSDSSPASATIVVFPGNAGNRGGRLPLARALSERGLATLLVDYRGYGGNPGSPTETGLAADARAAVEYLRARPDIDADRIVYFGESLGAGVAVTLATTHPPAALVLRSPFTSLADVGAHHYPWLPVAALARDRYPNIETIEQINTPVLVVAGSADRIVPPTHSRRLYDAVSGQKRFGMVDGAGHNDLALLAGQELVDAMVAFVEDAVGLKGR